MEQLQVQRLRSEVHMWCCKSHGFTFNLEGSVRRHWTLLAWRMPVTRQKYGVKLKAPKSVACQYPVTGDTGDNPKSEVIE